MPMEADPMVTVSTNGMDLSASPVASILFTEIVQDGASSLCLQAAKWRGYPLCLHPFAQNLDQPTLYVVLHWKSIA